MLSSSSWGCELKYMHLPYNSLQQSSSSSWGCELKCMFRKVYGFSKPVILFVRMWVEITALTLVALIHSSSSSWGCELKYCSYICHTFQISSSSSWGCELKYSNFITRLVMFCHPLREDVSWNVLDITLFHMFLVILFVRMWVEISIYFKIAESDKSSSSWGCELKLYTSSAMFSCIRSSSSWGCELK